MRTLLPWILIGVSVLGGIGLLIWNSLQPDEEDEITPLEGPNSLAVTAAERKVLAQTAEEYRGSGRKSLIMSMKASFEKSLDTTIGPRASTRNRMTMPWFMLVGADGSGRQTVLSNNGLPLPYGPPMEVDNLRKDAGKWWLYEDAVILEAPDAAPGSTEGMRTLPPEQTVADASIGWHTLLHMLRRERPDSPLNGIIVTISCADLLSGRAEPAKLADQADRIRNFLERTRKALGVRLPLHVLVTKCDILPGFRSFAQTLPEQRRGDVFGWSNPNDVEKPFNDEWVATGFDDMRRQLADLRDELLAAPENVADTVGLFVFDGEFVDMQEPLRDFVAKLMPEGERRPSLFFRGMYFTGDVTDPTPQDQAVTVRAERGASSALTSTDHSLVFLRSLFAERIFKEAGLARPTARLRLARDRRVVIAQAAAALLLLGGSAGLYTAVYGWQRDAQVEEEGLITRAQSLTRVLSGLAIDLEDIKRSEQGAGTESASNRRANDAAVIELVGQIREVPNTRVRSAFLPTSWFSPLPNDIRISMMRGVQNIVLPVTRRRLQERADRLLGPVAQTLLGSDDESIDLTDPRSLPRYLNDVRLLSRNIERYNALAGPTTGSVADLLPLLDYLFGERFAADSDLATPDFENALRNASGPAIVVTPAMAASVINRAVSSAATVASEAGRQLAPRAALSTRPKDAEDDLHAIDGLAALIDLVETRTGLVAAVSDSAILGVRMARAIQDSIDAQLRFAAARIRRDTLSPAEAADTLKRVVSGLYKTRLMVPRDYGDVVAEIPAGRRLRWDVGLLELALALRGEYLQAVLSLASAFPEQPPERLQRALEVQLLGRSLDIAARAQRFVPGDSLSLVEIRAEAANLDAAAVRTVRLATMLDSLGAAGAGRKLIAAGARQAEHTLASAQALLDQEKYFTPQTGKIAVWQGVIPIGYAALGVTDSLNAYTTLINYTTEVRTLAHEVAPALRYLRLTVVDSIHTPRLLSDWEEIATEVARFERLDYTGSLGLLHRFMRENMAVSDLTSCAGSSGDLEEARQSGDFFVRRRRQYQASMSGRCRGAAGTAVAAYTRLRTLFAARLAGRFPFVDSVQAARALDADPASVREFFRMYDAFALAGDEALRSDPRLSQVGRGAIGFLDQIATVRAFLAPIVESGDRQPAELSVLVAPHGDDAHEVRWRYGDSLHVATLVDSLGVETPVFARGGWAPIRYARQRRDSSNLRFFHPETKMELLLPVTFPYFAPDIVIPRPR